LRGAKSGPNYDEVHVKQVKQQLKKGGLDPKIMIDCSHGNSQKNHLNQPKVLENIVIFLLCFFSFFYLNQINDLSFFLSFLFPFSFFQRQNK